MIEEDFPHKLGEGRVDACKDREKVGLEHLDGTFSGVAAMDIQRDDLELDTSLLLDDVPVFRTGFVVKDFNLTLCNQALMSFMMEE